MIGDLTHLFLELKVLKGATKLMETRHRQEVPRSSAYHAKMLRKRELSWQELEEGRGG